jgi:16S rRNA (guanine527-N7)-methyltransferase
MPIDLDLLGRGLEALGLPRGGRLAEGLGHYAAEIELWNPAYGLVGAEGDELVIKHLLDSLAPLSIIEELLAGIEAGRAPEAGEAGRSAFIAAPPLRLADIGTGAGLPGIPLALALPRVEVSLVERMGKRVRFLENEKLALGLSNARVVESEVERVDGRFEILTFRAFRPFERKLFKKVFALCETDGRVVAYKGKRDKAEAELSEIEGLYSAVEIRPVKVPFLEDERCLVILTPARKGG